MNKLHKRIQMDIWSLNQDIFNTDIFNSIMD